MSTYTYQGSNIIDQVTFHETTAGAMRACLHVKDGIDAALLQPIMQDFHERNWQAVPTSEHGRPELELRGFSSEKQLIRELTGKGWIKGESQLEADKKEPASLLDKIKKKSLFVAGMLYFVGDVKFFRYGFKSGNKLDMAGGVNYFLGSLSSFLFARKDASDLQIHDLSKDMAEHVRQQHIALPDDASLAHIIDDYHKTPIRKIDDTLRHYPAELMNTFFGVAGICIATAAYKKLGHAVDPQAIEEFVAKQLKAHQARFPNTELVAADIAALRQKSSQFVHKMHHTANKLDIGLGTMTASAGAVATLIREKSPDPDEPPKKGPEALWEWVQEHPMSIAGVGLMAATMCHAVSTGIEYKIGATSGKSAIIDRGTFVLSNLMAELLITISSKGHGAGVTSDPSVAESIIAVAADLIARQPVDLQPKLIESLCEYLGRPDVLAMKNEEVASRLTHQVEALRKNPWAQSMTLRKDAGQPQAATGAWGPKIIATQQARAAQTGHCRFCT